MKTSALQRELTTEWALLRPVLASSVPYSLAVIGTVWALLVVGVPLEFGWPFGVLAFGLAVIGLADFKAQLLPLGLVALVGLGGAWLNYHAGVPVWQIAAGGGVAWFGALVLGGISSTWAGRPALGAGDVWLAGAVGLLLGLSGLAPWLLAVAGLGLGQIIWLLWRGGHNQPMPFAPILVFGAWLALLYADAYYQLVLP
jgi:prepilin signal peptidase PulO-like enzyme (type II secretory pathway)